MIKEHEDEIDQDLVLRAITLIQEHGYDANIYWENVHDEKPVVISNWNEVEKTLPNMASWLDDIGVWIGYEDEWISCDTCGQAIFTTPMYHGDNPKYIIGDGYALCRDCWLDEPELDPWINCGLTDIKAVYPWQLKLFTDAGFICYEDKEACKIFETGFHHGMNDTPEKALELLERKFPRDSVDYIFVITDTGQFHVHWSIFIRPATL